MRLERRHISVSLGITVLAWWIVLLVQGAQVGWEYLKPFGTVVGVLVLFGWSLEKKLWYRSWLHGWFVKRPDLRGTWRVELESDWIDPVTEKQAPLIIGYMGVAQSLSDLQMHLMTSESESWFVAHGINESPNGKGYQIVGVYTNKPSTLLRGGRSEMHFGGLILNTHGDLDNRPRELKGEYWTDRKTKGGMKLEARRSKLFTSFEDAKQGFGTTCDL